MVKQRRGIYLLPNLFTTAALFAGFYSIVAAMNARYESAAIAIFIAMILDAPFASLKTQAVGWGCAGLRS